MSRREAVRKLARSRPRSRAVRWSVAALVALAAWAWISGEIEVRDAFSARRVANVERFLVNDATPFPLLSWPLVGAISFVRLISLKPSGESVLMINSPRSLNIQIRSPFRTMWIVAQRSDGTAVRSSQTRSPFRPSRQRNCP